MKPVVELGEPGVPGEGGVVRVADGNDAAGPADPAHLAQRSYRIGDMLKHLVCVHNVETRIPERQVVHVGDLETDARGVMLGFADHLRLGVDRGDVADPGREAGRDRARPAAHVEQRHLRAQVGEQVARRVLGGAPAMRPQYRLMMPVRVRRHAGNPSSCLT